MEGTLLFSVDYILFLLPHLVLALFSLLFLVGFLPAFSQVLSGLWDVSEGETVVNPRQFFNIFKEAVPYFSGYR